MHTFFLRLSFLSKCVHQDLLFLSLAGGCWHKGVTNSGGMHQSRAIAAGLHCCPDPHPADPSTINGGKRLGGPEGDNPSRSCVLVTTPTNGKVDNLLHRVHQESYDDAVFRDRVLADHPAPWLRLYAERTAALPLLKSFDQNKVEKTLGRTPGCKPTMVCAAAAWCLPKLRWLPTGTHFFLGLLQGGHKLGLPSPLWTRRLGPTSQPDLNWLPWAMSVVW